VDGSLICQRKGLKAIWEDVKEPKLSQIKAGECVAVNLDSKQTENLISGLDDLKAIAAQRGVHLGRREVIVADPDEVVAVNDKNRKLVIEQLIERKYGQEVWDAIPQTDPDLASRLSNSRIQNDRQVALSTFEKHLQTQDRSEPQWEDFFWANQWIFGYGLRYQFLGLEQRQANYGGESYRGSGKQRGEFLARSAGYESFTVVVEIKKPQTPIFAEREYRSGVPGFSQDFISGISQAQVNSRTWDTEGSQRLGDRELLEGRRIFTIAPRSILVIGSLKQLEKAHRRQSFQLFRDNVHNPDILTFDELFERAKYIVQSGIESPTESSEDFPDDSDIPF
jgi:Shedu protein SduA, C-terminal